MRSAATRRDDPPRKARTGRAAELGLLIFAAGIVTAALVIVELNQQRTISWRLAAYGAGYLAGSLLAHLVVRKFAPYADPVLLPLVSLLNGLGLVMIYRLDLARAAAGRANCGIPADSPQAPTQLLWTGVALACMLGALALVRDHRKLADYSYTLLLVGLVFLALPSVLPASLSEVNGAKIWIKIPGVASIQPAEFAKIALIVFVAAYLAQKQSVLTGAGKKFLGLTLPRGRDLAPLLVALLICLGVLVRGKDLGTSLLIFGVVLVMLYMATQLVSWMIIGLLGFAGGCYLAYQLFGHVRQRVDIWLDPFADPTGSGYQLVQSLFGFGTGGIFGTGLGAGRPNIVPCASTDFITAGLGEELGLVGLTMILLCYLLLSGRGIRAGLATQDGFGKLLGAGLAFTLVFQMFIVVGGVTRLIPLTGLTTPFLSYGGSSLLANYIILALLLRISDSSRKPIEAPEDTQPSPQPLSEASTAMVPLVKPKGDEK